jgi:peptidoglycan hydrolase CwlO-like protein
MLALPQASLAVGAIGRAKARAARLHDQIMALDARMQTLAARYDTSAARLSAVNASIAANELRLQRARAAEVQQRQALVAQAVAMYKTPNTTLLSAVVTAHSIDELWSDVRMARTVFDQGTVTLGAIRALQQDIRERGLALAGERHEAQALLAQVARQRQQVNAAVKRGEQLLAQARSHVKTLVKQAKARRAAARRAAAAARRAAAAAAGGGAVTGVAGDYTPSTWAQALLGYLGMPRTSSNVTAIVSWELAEGGHWFNGARYNPLDTTMPEPGATDMNSVGVKAYTSWAEGFVATVTTLRNGLYGPILVALQKGNDAMAVAEAVAASPWGTEPFSA